MRLARVITRLNVGGPARHVLAAARGLSPEVETTLFTGEVGPDEAEATAWIDASGVRPERVPGLGREVRPFADFQARRTLVRRFRELKPDVVHTHTAKAGALGRAAARKARVPLTVHTFHGHVFDGYFGKTVSRMVVAAERRLAARTDVLVAVSQEVASDLADKYRIAPRDKIRVIPPGIDLAPYDAAEERRGEFRRELRITDDVPLIVWLGRVVDVKDPSAALVAFDHVAVTRRDAVLVVVGDGPLRKDLERGARSRVRFLGWRDDVARILADADVALLSSRNEGTPVALIEAAASGVPAVATRVGGVPSVVQDGETGLLVEPGDVQSLASALRRLVRDRDLSRRMGETARRRARDRFSEARMLRDLRELYRSVGLR